MQEKIKNTIENARMLCKKNMQENRTRKMNSKNEQQMQTFHANRKFKHSTRAGKRNILRKNYKNTARKNKSKK